MKNNNKMTVFILVCALFSGGAGWLLTENYIYSEVKHYQSSFDLERKAVPIVVAAQDLDPGTIITANTAQIREIPNKYVHKNAVGPNTYETRLNGKKLAYAVKSGEPILPIHVLNNETLGLSSLIESGERAITIPVDSLDTLSGFLNPGDFVDLYITVKDGQMDRTAPLVENVRVLATGQDIYGGFKKDFRGHYQEISLGVKPLYASKILHAQTVGNISVLLRSKKDQNSRFDSYVTIDNLVDIPQTSIEVVEQSKNWGFELIKGGTRF